MIRFPSTLEISTVNRSRCYCTLSFLLLTGVEDLENFHGKALGDKGVKAIEEIEKLLSSEKDVLKPKPAVEDAPKVVTPEPVALSEAPSYAVGQKVKELTF